MQAKEKPVLRPLSRDEYRVLEVFSVGLGIPLKAVAHNPMALQVPGAVYYDVFDVPPPIARILGKLPGVYSAGYYIGYIEGLSFTPSIPLAVRLSRLCTSIMECIVLNAEGERLFIYGKSVWGDDKITKWKPGLAVVVNDNGEALGWGRGKTIKFKGSTIPVVEPVRDLGWYLRRGG
ncbi:MAG: hypothetical protein GSR85_02770 [Desulfurococcales archaeon]|nr:hypothetical protein [Desulfurococcales archaeon]